MRLYQDGRNGPFKPCSGNPWRETQRLIVSYQWLARNKQALAAADTHFDFVVFDEAHHARYLNVANPFEEATQHVSRSAAATQPSGHGPCAAHCNANADQRVRIVGTPRGPDERSME